MPGEDNGYIFVRPGFDLLPGDALFKNFVIESPIPTLIFYNGHFVSVNEAFCHKLRMDDDALCALEKPWEKLVADDLKNEDVVLKRASRPGKSRIVGPINTYFRGDSLDTCSFSWFTGMNADGVGFSQAPDVHNEYVQEAKRYQVYSDVLLQLIGQKYIDRVKRKEGIYEEENGAVIFVKVKNRGNLEKQYGEFSSKCHSIVESNCGWIIRETRDQFLIVTSPDSISKNGNAYVNAFYIINEVAKIAEESGVIIRLGATAGKFIITHTYAENPRLDVFSDAVNRAARLCEHGAGYLNITEDLLSGVKPKTRRMSISLPNGSFFKCQEFKNVGDTKYWAIKKREDLSGFLPGSDIGKQEDQSSAGSSKFIDSGELSFEKLKEECLQRFVKDSSIPAWIVCSGANGKKQIIAANKAFVEMMGYDKNDLDALWKEDYSEMFQSENRARTEDAPATTEYSVVNLKGEKITIDLRAAPSSDAGIQYYQANNLTELIKRREQNKEIAETLYRMIPEKLLTRSLNPLPKEEQFKGALLHFDIVGSSTLYRRGLEPLVNKNIRDFFDKCFEIAERYHGWICNTAGDDMLIVFSNFSSDEIHPNTDDDVKSALACALEITKIQKEFVIQMNADETRSLSVRIGLSVSDEVNALLPVSQDTPLCLPYGKAIDEVCELERQALPGSINVSVNFYEKVRGVISVDSRRCVYIMGEELARYEELGSPGPGFWEAFAAQESGVGNVPFKPALTGCH